MTWTTRLLAIVNTVVAGVLFWYVGLSAYKRADFADGLDRLRRTKDGISTPALFQEVFKNLSPEEKDRLLDAIDFDESESAPNPEGARQFLARLSPADREFVKTLQDRKKTLRQVAIDKARQDRLAEKMPVRVPFRAQSDTAKRNALAEIFFNPVNGQGFALAGPALIPFEVDEDALYKLVKDKNSDNVEITPKGNDWYSIQKVGELEKINYGSIVRPGSKVIAPDPKGDPSKLLLSGKQEAKTLQDASYLLGFETFRRLYRESILLHQHRLTAQEAELADRKATLKALQIRYDYELGRFKESADLFLQRIDAEKLLRTAISRENDERRSELTRIYAEMAEAFAAREAAEGRYRDAVRQEQDAKADIDELTQKNKKLLEEISGPAAVSKK